MNVKVGPALTTNLRLPILLFCLFLYHTDVDCSFEDWRWRQKWTRYNKKKGNRTGEGSGV